MKTLNGDALEIIGNKLREDFVSDDYKQRRYNLDALKNLFIQDLRTQNKRANGFVTGAIIGGMMDASVGDDSIVDGMVIGGLLGSSTSYYETGAIYATLQFFDNETLNVKFDEEAELILLQEFAIKNHNNPDAKTIKSLETVAVDKNIFNSTQNEGRIKGVAIMILAIIVAMMDRYSVFSALLENSDNTTPIGQFATDLASPYTMTFIATIFFIGGVYQFFNAGGRVVVENKKH